MLHSGDIVIERLTGRRVMVIEISATDVVTCRFTDGRLEERYPYELEEPLSVLGSTVALLRRMLLPRDSAEVDTGGEQTRPLLVRRSQSA